MNFTFAHTKLMIFSLSERLPIKPFSISVQSVWCCWYSCVDQDVYLHICIYIYINALILMCTMSCVYVMYLHHQEIDFTAFSYTILLVGISVYFAAITPLNERRRPPRLSLLFVPIILGFSFIMLCR